MNNPKFNIIQQLLNVLKLDSAHATEVVCALLQNALPVNIISLLPVNVLKETVNSG